MPSPLNILPYLKIIARTREPLNKQPSFGAERESS